MEDIDCYLCLCLRNYAARHDLDKYYWRDRLLKAANMKPGQPPRLLAHLCWLIQVLGDARRRALMRMHQCSEPISGR